MQKKVQTKDLVNRHLRQSSASELIAQFLLSGNASVPNPYSFPGGKITYQSGQDARPYPKVQRRIPLKSKVKHHSGHYQVKEGSHQGCGSRLDTVVLPEADPKERKDGQR
jgi:hypothetical protein